jgi:hypothetical protein
VERELISCGCTEFEYETDRLDNRHDEDDGDTSNPICWEGVEMVSLTKRPVLTLTITTLSNTFNTNKNLCFFG